MKLIFIIEDFLDGGGFPSEMRSFIAAVVETSDVSVLVRASKIKSEFANSTPTSVDISQYSAGSFFQKLSNQVGSTDASVVVSCGYINMHTPLAAFWCRMRSVPFVIIPVSQATVYNLQEKLFFENPDVNKLMSMAFRVSTISRRAKKFLTVTIKNVFHGLIGRQVLALASAVGVFSGFEESQVQLLTKGKVVRFIPFLWGLSALPLIPKRQGYYIDTLRSPGSVKRFVYWGRLDFAVKGLDRLLHALEILSERGPVPFHIYLMGPDYNGGEEKIRHLILKNNLSDLISIVPREKYEGLEKQPLIEADASILLSRWDGLPRALRESVSFGVPVLVSKETNFYDLVTENNLGIAVSDADAPLSIADALISLCDQESLEAYNSSCMAFREKLLWRAIAPSFVKSIKGVVYAHERQ